jgi:DNA ligase-1
MEYRELVEMYEQLDATSSTLEKTDILAAAFAGADEAHLPVVVTLARGKLFAAWESDDIGVSTNLTKEAIAKATGIDDEQLEDWWRETGDLGNAAAKAVAERTQTTLVSENLDVLTVHDTLRELTTYEGEGSQQRRVDAIAQLLTNAEPAEARFIVRTVVGAMRLGVGEGTVRDAIADAFLDGSETAVRAVERAHQVTNDFRVVAKTASEQGREGLEELDVEVFRPIKVMLAQKAEAIEHGRSEVAEAPQDVLWEYKYDGIRTQIHSRDDRVEVYTRRLENVTTQFPEVAEAAQQFLDADEYIVEGEIVGIDPETGRPVPFQQLSKRVKRKYDIEAMQAEIPVVVYLFDVLYVDGESLLNTPLRGRIENLEQLLDPSGDVVERAANRVALDTDAASAFYQQALDDGQEGLMLKNLDAGYQPGSRVGYMMKLKPTMEPLDLVVSRAKWSEGRRSEFLGRVYLACRDPESGEFLEIGRMATGFTDEELAGVTERLEPLIQQTDGREVTVEPEVVLEVEYEEIQESPEYGSGYALRFPRFRSFRDDLSPEAIDTRGRVEELYESQ